MNTDIEKEILLAAPRGFCAGVDRAIEVVEKALALYGKPLYVKHEIVHNKHVVGELRDKGVSFVEEISDVPEDQTVIFSAHGVDPRVVADAKAKSLNIIDATCPLVTKVHLEARRYAKEEYEIILIGHKNHVEAIGTLGEAPEKITIIENEEDIKNLDIKGDKIAYLTQTTLSVSDTKGLIEILKVKYPHIEGPSKSDICYATTNRQEAVTAIAPNAEVMLVVGSVNSSNSTRLKELAETFGVKSYLIDSSDDIDSTWLKSVTKIGLTSGASAPEKLVQDVISFLQTKGFEKVTEVNIKDEDVTFKLPKKLVSAK